MTAPTLREMRTTLATAAAYSKATIDIWVKPTYTRITITWSEKDHASEMIEDDDIASAFYRLLHTEVIPSTQADTHV